MRFLIPSAASVGLLLLGAACGNTAGGGAGTGQGGGAAGECPDNLKDAPSSEFCSDAKAPTDCTQVSPAVKDQVCGVPMVEPTDELGRSANVKEFAGSGPPDLGCFAPAGYRKAGTPATVKVSGTIKIFAKGCDSKNVTVEFHKVNRSGPAGDPDLGDLIGTPFISPDGCQATGVASDYPGCDKRYECKYTYDGVPTETELLVVTKGNFWGTIYDFNNYIPNEEVQAGVWNHDVRALASDDYTLIAQTAIGAPISPGNGAIAGEVHDCGDVRLHGATVNTEVPRASLTYFTNDEQNPLPQTQATSTSNLALYAALDVAPGPASVGALGLVDGKITTVGYYRVRVFPDAVSVVTFRGPRPFQVPQQ